MYVLHTYPDRFVIDADVSLAASALAVGDSTLAPATHTAPDSLIIDRATGKLSRCKPALARPSTGAASFVERIDGIVGIIK